MVKWGNFKDLFSTTEFFGRDLNGGGKNFENVNSRDDDKNQDSIGHEGDYGEICPECEGSDIAHVEFSGLDIKPEKCNESSYDDETQCRQNHESTIVADECIHRIIKQKKSSSKPIKSVGDIDRICHRDHYKHEESQVNPTDINRSKEREINT